MAIKPIALLCTVVIFSLFLHTTQGQSESDLSSETSDTTLFWEQLFPEGLIPEERFLPAHDSKDNIWTIVGGEKHGFEDTPNVIFQDVWNYNFLLNTWVDKTKGIQNQISSSTWRSGVYTTEGYFVVWGGRAASTGYLSILDPDFTYWTSEQAYIPVPQLAGQSMFSYAKNESAEEYVYVFGGTEEFSTYGEAAMYRYKLGSLQDWEQLGTHDTDAHNKPAGRYFASLAYRSQDNSWYLFGGTRNVYTGDHLNDIWRYSLDVKKWEEVIVSGECKPSKRALHAAAISPDGTGMFVYGGLHTDIQNDDLWMFHFNSKTWVEFDTAQLNTTIDIQRYGHSMKIWQDPMTEETWLYTFAGYEATSYMMSFVDEVEQFNDIRRISLDDIGCSLDDIETCKHVKPNCDGLYDVKKWEVELVFAFVILAIVCVGVLVVVGYYYKRKKAALTPLN
eukprot:TRINITY_DN5074_c0_g7_i1.p1 TRINITY_DN5074_c0_g7~~TRINITY_DN5074_c0_g7_i1.p1  ORF type:complete len:448 (-),score=84.53 TRINITY_DN5074_c0_g7_i1:3-1346(-)